MASKNSKKSTPTQQKNPIVHFYGTKTEWVKHEFPYPEFNMNTLFNTGLNDRVVVCEDEQGLYITGKSYVGALSLDPYRMYKRRVPVVNEDGSYQI